MVGGLALLAVSTVGLTGPGVSTLSAQDEPGIKLAVGDVGLAIGDVPRIDGVRLNFRDLHLERVRGLNVTIWEPHEESRGIVRGLAVGLPLTGAREIDGVALGVGTAVENDFTGIAAAPLGLGAGGRIRGIAVGGIGVGVGGRLTGLTLSGIGAGARRFEGASLASAYFRIEEEGLLRGVSVAAFNDIRGRQHGVTIGLLNIARNRERFSVLPLVNYHP